MLRRASICFAVSLLLLAPACRKKEGDEPEVAAEKKGDKSDKAATVEQPTPTPTPTPTPEPVAPAGDSGATKTDSGGAGSSGGGSGGGAAAPREDLTCDPLDTAGCLEGEQCIGGQGCDVEWSCDADIVCTKGVKEYCGCDGRTFEAVYGNCPWQKYQYPGPCK
jgi:hypothetical protein